jgi:enamine deaminase RidA (YjgF/YER057c/UK114 family)
MASSTAQRVTATEPRAEQTRLVLENTLAALAELGKPSDRRLASVLVDENGLLEVVGWLRTRQDWDVCHLVVSIQREDFGPNERVRLSEFVQQQAFDSAAKQGFYRSSREGTDHEPPPPG